MKYNYIKHMKNHLAQADAETALTGEKPTLLLHVCCAPCSSHVLEILSAHFSITILYYNPNIHPAAEYERRLSELQNFLVTFPPAQGIKLAETRYDPEEYFAAAGTRGNPLLQKEAEKGERCGRCYRLRMEKAFEYAFRCGFAYVATVLSISPHKDSQKINSIGGGLESLYAQKNGGRPSPRFLYADFKKEEGFKRSLAISAQYGLYRQDYCGCIYSMKNSGVL